MQLSATASCVGLSLTPHLFQLCHHVGPCSENASSSYQVGFMLCEVGIELKGWTARDSIIFKYLQSSTRVGRMRRCVTKTRADNAIWLFLSLPIAAAGLRMAVRQPRLQARGQDHRALSTLVRGRTAMS